MAKKTRPGTARLKKQNEIAKNAASIINENLSGRSAGRPPKYHEDFVNLVEKISLIGCTNYQLGELFGVHEPTIADWLAQHPSFNAAVTRGRAATDDRVENALLARALGYEHPEEKIFCSTLTGRIVRANTTMRYPPSEKALDFWLRNRRPDKWRSQQPENTATPDDAARLLREQMASMDSLTEGEKK